VQIFDSATSWGFFLEMPKHDINSTVSLPMNAQFVCIVSLFQLAAKCFLATVKS